jgi:hypothetical protein
VSSSQQPWINPGRALRAYTVIFCVFIIWASARTALHPGPHRIGIRILALAEIAGALFFVIRKTRLVGLVLLLGVFAIAAVLELHLREWPVRFVFYAATALFVQFLSNFSNRGTAQSA